MAGLGEKEGAIKVGTDIFAEDMAEIALRFGQNERFADKTVVITGCAGFLGFYLSHYFARLADHGLAPRRLVLLDRFPAGKPGWLAQLQDRHPFVTAAAYDVARSDERSAAELAEAHYIIHMASIASPIQYRQYPLETIEANVWGFRRLLDAGRQSLSLEGLLYFSSSEIYGDPETEFIPTPESYCGHVATMGPRACYDESKRLGETLGYVYHEQFGVPVRIVRPFNNYGPGMSLQDGRVPADFARSVLRGEPLVIHSDGSPTRTFCYITDAIVGYLKVLVHSAFDCFNIGMDKPEISIAGLAEIYREAGARRFGYAGEVRYVPASDERYLIDSPMRRCPDLRRARVLLGYDPVVTLESGVDRFLAYLQKAGSL
ncbi:NAD-dependent epimerase/dehydratase family protein [Paenibacillus phyllosphaerae]|nr:NAD-dependent epimerase/dehydratase family protein [Paenibacillus phyllosphaerae]